MIDGDSKAMWIGAGVAYDVQNIVSFGVTGAVVHSTWAAVVDQDTMPDLYAAVQKTGGQSTADALGYTDDGLEKPDYAAHLDFGGEEGASPARASSRPTPSPSRRACSSTRATVSPSASRTCTPR